METIAFNTDFNSLGSFFALVSFGTVAGGLFALLYWQCAAAHSVAPVTRRGGARPAATRALGIFMVPILLFTVSAYCAYLTPFFAARLSRQNLVLEYRFPARAVTVPLSQVDRVVKGLGGRVGRWAHLEVLLKDGRKFESAPIKSERLDVLRNEILRQAKSRGNQ